MEVSADAARQRVQVQAMSIRVAVELVEKRYPGDAVQVVFPISPEEFFMGKAGVATGLIEP